MHHTTLPSFSQIGSLYFVEDYPSSEPPLTSPLAGILNFENIRIGPITDFLWWRPYHDEAHLDRGPFNTVEEYVLGAVRLERRAVERHRADPSSLVYTNSSLDDLDEVVLPLNKVEALVPRIRDIIALSSRPERLMQNVLMHPNISAANIIVPELNDTNAIDRMSNHTLIDWSGATVLPLAFQFHTPLLATYIPRIFLRPNRVPLFVVTGTKEVPFPDVENAPPEALERVGAEHRLAMRNMQLFSTKPEYAELFQHPIQASLNSLSHVILRSCADGPHVLRVLLVHIQRSWQKTWGPCPFEFSEEEMEKHVKEVERNRRYEMNLSRLMNRVGCASDGSVSGGDEECEVAVKMREIVKKEWIDDECGGPFPFEEGEWALHLR